ncbi:hypothetical protein FLA_4065 [Filimonas lacunae]|nr:hypothetical protein FLA_4065 [Filimonas lacunae]
MMVSVTTGNVPRVPYIIKGCVLSASDQKPVEKVYVSTVVGEEEALTDKNGNFELNTWEKLPVTLQVQHADFVPEKIVLTDVSQKQVFRLKKK